MSDENIEILAQSIYEASEKSAENLSLKQLEKALKENERNKSKLTQIIMECDSEILRKTFYEELNKLIEEKAQIEKQLTVESITRVKLTKGQIKSFLTYMQKGRVDNPQYRQRLINLFVNRIYLYNDKILLIMNVENGEKHLTVSLLSYIMGQLNRIVDSCAYIVGVPSKFSPSTDKKQE
ncbi:MAG: hypothetical protein FWD58_05370 [Firmicutes bacterium]|nr:hypothetical protein [Bacillota bacterium]